jgi:hypothetical protein
MRVRGRRSQGPLSDRTRQIPYRIMSSVIGEQGQSPRSAILRYRNAKAKRAMPRCCCLATSGAACDYIVTSRCCCCLLRCLSFHCSISTLKMLDTTRPERLYTNEDGSDCIGNRNAHLVCTLTQRMWAETDGRGSAREN